MRIDNRTKQLLSNPETRRAWVLYQLTLQGESLASVARRAKVSRQAMQKVLTYPYPKMEKVLADFLGLPPMVLFPDRYDRHGLPNRRRGRPRNSDVMQTKNNTRTHRRNVSAKVAA